MRRTWARGLGLRDATAASGRRLPHGRLCQRLIQMGDRVLKQAGKPRPIDWARGANPASEPNRAAVQRQLDSPGFRLPAERNLCLSAFCPGGREGVMPEHGVRVQEIQATRRQIAWRFTQLPFPGDRGRNTG
jgi:hypothetical protein